MSFDTQLAWSLIPSLLRGLGLSILVVVPSFLLGPVLAFPLALARRSANPVLRRSAQVLATVLQGTPLLVLLYFIYNGLPRVGLVRNTFLWLFFSKPYWCAVLACSINHGAAVSEVLFGALAVVPRGLVEAAESLGLRRAAILYKIELPLALRYGLSAYRNEVVLFFKATSVVGAITLYDVLRVARQAIDTTFDPLTPLLMAAAFYWCSVQLLRYGLDRAEARLHRVAQARP